MVKELDIVLFGATGVTGKNAIPIIAKLALAKGRELSWGIAGRSEEKLKQVLAESETKLGESLSGIPIIKADAGDEESLVKMAKQARLVINCVGPFRFYGEQVVKACIQENTHHIDVSGEPQFIESIAVKYHKEAEEKGIYIISACGLDSIPADLGIIFLQQKFGGTVNSVETYLEFGSTDPSLPGSAANFTTWESAVHGLAHSDELRSLRKQLYPKPLPKFTPKLRFKDRPQKCKVVDGWMIPFMGADKPVARRSQHFLYEEKKQRPVQVETYFVVNSFVSLVFTILIGLLFTFLAKYSFGRSLLLKYPEIFSLGIFSKTPPSEEKQKSSTFKITLHGEGWKESLSGPDDQYTTPIDQKIRVTVSGTNPGYGATNFCLVLAAIKVLTETDKIPGKGGVLSPGFAFQDTTLVEELNENDVKFDVEYVKSV